MPAKRARRRYSPDEKAFWRGAIPGRSHADILALFNARPEFDPLTLAQLISFIGNNGVNTGRTGRFTKGNVPHNKGKKRWWAGGEATRFRPGNVPWNHLPVGSERVTSDGYAELKIADPKKWRAKHALIWEAANGPVPKGHVVIFADGDRSNIAPDNLLLVSRAGLAVMNKCGLISADAGLTRAGAAVAGIKMRINELEKKKRGHKGEPCKRQSEGQNGRSGQDRGGGKG